MFKYLAGVVGVLLTVAGLAAQDGLPPCPPTIVVAPAPAPPPPPPPARIVLGPRHSQVIPCRSGHAHTGDGNVDVAQPYPDTVVVTMTGVAAAGANPCKESQANVGFEFGQEFEIRFDSPKLKKAKLVVEGRIIGLLRSTCRGGGSAEVGQGCATVDAGGMALLTVCTPPAAVTGGQNVSVNHHEGPSEAPIVPGKYALHETFGVSATHPRTACPGKAIAEFGSDSGLDGLWITAHDPFSGASKKDFGFQVTIKVVRDTGNGLSVAAAKNRPGLTCVRSTPKEK